MTSSGQLRPGGLLFTLALLLGDARCSCNTGTANECKSARFVPGANLAGEGYDVVTLRTTGAFVIDVNTWRQPDGACTLCGNPLMANARQRLPLALVDWRTLQSCKRALSTRLFRSASELGQSENAVISNEWQADLEVKPKPGIAVSELVAGSKSKLTQFAATRSKSDRYSFTSHQFQCRYYRYRVKDKPLLAAQFSRVLALLPNASQEGTKYHYQKLVATYGTHFIKAVELGGRFKDVTAVRTCKAASEGYSTEEIKDCLEIEASGRVGLKVSGSAKFKRCKELARTLKHSDSFHQTFNDRETEVTGGNASAGADLFFSEDSSAFTRWSGSLAANPGLVSYALEPLHHLLPRDDPRHANLRRYISDYIMANALTRDCGAHSCPAGSQPGRRDRCSCFCREDSQVDKICCPKEKGLGRLVVMVKAARDLWGDYSTATDGYIVVKYGRKATGRTSVINNNNNPVWNAQLDLGVVKAELGQELTIEVWDKDDIFKDDHLGSCTRPLTSGRHSEICYLRYGSVSFDFSFTCGPHLGGATCQDYVARPDGPTFTASLGGILYPLGPVSLAAPPSEGDRPSVRFP